jgi:predicted O-methyltransferase YrrM
MIKNGTPSLLPRAYRSAAARLQSIACRAEKRFRELQFAELSLADDIPTWTRPAELEALYRLATECPQNANIVEYGSYLGASTCYLAAGATGKEARIFCIDTWLNDTINDGIPEPFAKFQENVAGVSQMITTLRKRTSEVQASDLRLPVHLAFLDADHSYEATRADATFIMSMMAPDGVIAFHDTSSFAGVSRALGEILVAGRWRMAGHVETLTWVRPACDAPAGACHC